MNFVLYDPTAERVKNFFRLLDRARLPREEGCSIKERCVEGDPHWWMKENLTGSGSGQSPDPDPDGAHQEVCRLISSGELSLEELNFAEPALGTPLYYATECGLADVVDLLLEKGVGVNLKSKNGLTALHAAAKFGNSLIAQLLLDRGADIDAQSDIGYTPLVSASEFNKVDTLNLLLEAGANPLLRTEVDSRAFNFAANCGKFDTKEEKLAQRKEVQRILKNAERRWKKGGQYV